jgi:endonuclease YncB( thermonuclease family)
MVTRSEGKLNRAGKSVMISVLGSLVLMAIIAFVRGPFSSSRKKSHPKETRERVEFVIDGDTVKLAGGERVRLLGIDAPEMRKGKPGRSGPFPEPGAKEATAALKRMIEGKVVRVARRGRDKYDRTLARLYLEDGKDVGGELVRRGLVVRYSKR